jgi:hypothetical protein
MNLPRRLFAGVLALPPLAISVAIAFPALAENCRLTCPNPNVGIGSGALTASYIDSSFGVPIASNMVTADSPYTYRLLFPCAAAQEAGEPCQDSDDRACDAPADRVIRELVLQQRRLVLQNGATIDGYPVDQGTPPGTPVGPWQSSPRECIDITALNPAPSPDEVFRYFQRLPLPQLETRQQPPGDALVGLPVIFFTDGASTQTYSLDIRGFTVDIVATAEGFTWHTGDGTTLTTTDPGAPYPAHTITHDYASGTYTASLTTTWGGTFTVDGSASVDVPGTTTTDGPPVTFTVVEARAVLTNPYD